ncbi:response regulator transcription factor [Streptomyces sp. NPDC004959]|uniref:response regulator transcription factor n=1 Tax=unclassified Streptomyces TaxID=2593676 RepID=UPI0004C5779F|nr:response regulator transcription factor [Streptomyces sp. NRRL F-5630]
MSVESGGRVLRGEAEVFARAGHLLATAGELWCAARHLNTWVIAQDLVKRLAGTPPRLRKLYRPNALMSPRMAEHLRAVAAGPDAQVRITADSVNETIIIDRRFAILAGDTSEGRRSYSAVSEPVLVQNVASLFEAAWRSATDLAVYDVRYAELREMAPRVLELLASGCKDETAARALGLGVRTYRRRVAELMSALGAESRFQAGMRARDLGLI